MSELKILKEFKLNDSITAFAVESPYPRPDVIKYGIDPGTTNIGIAYVHPTPNVAVMLYWTFIIHPKNFFISHKLRDFFWVR